MCSLCLAWPCRNGCPNRAEQSFHDCSRCGEPITIGNDMWTDSADYICEDCMREMSALEFAEEYTGFCRVTADVEE